MRVVAPHPDVIVATSRVWQTNCTIVRDPGAHAGTQVAPALGEAFVIDSPIFPDELELLPALMEQAGFRFSGLVATHGDWDHLLGRLAFPNAALGCAQSTAARLAAEPGAAQRELRAFDDRNYVARPRPLALGTLQGLPVPGRCGIGDGELELHSTCGHTAEGLALWIAWAGVLVVGDYLSAVEIPIISPGGSGTEYLATLGRLRPVVERAAHVVPGHGPVLDSAHALTVLQQDMDYLQALLDRGAAAALPRGVHSPEQRRLHADNAARVARA
jgi:glyoxylase-like metal-dependent hydrolase (beta-lactamase superfamily II)